MAECDIKERLDAQDKSQDCDNIITRQADAFKGADNDQDEGNTDSQDNVQNVKKEGGEEKQEMREEDGNEEQENDNQQEEDADADGHGETEEEQWIRIFSPRLPASILRTVSRVLAFCTPKATWLFHVAVVEPLGDFFDVFIWLRYLWDNDTFLNNGGPVPLFYSLRDRRAALERIRAETDKWMEDEDNDEVLILDGDDMVMLMRLGYATEDMGFDEFEDRDDESDDEEREEAAFERARREVNEEEQPQVVALVKSGPRERGQGDDPGRIFVFAFSEEWREDIERVARQRTRDRARHLEEDLGDWLLAVALTVFVVVEVALLVSIIRDCSIGRDNLFYKLAKWYKLNLGSLIWG
ncbi:hypothetical protein QBC41DRAFT_372874 [Cercophora samala]|uniref:Uncharacterized protein n=1 Tax=Cercophora samala TaxID=330535 RepID=A0AA39ZFN2_9PEZI|nr:hypothetical protein QBC41DRAFT_372874 [Cercophora samala]